MQRKISILFVATTLFGLQSAAQNECSFQKIPGGLELPYKMMNIESSMEQGGFVEKDKEFVLRVEVPGFKDKEIVKEFHPDQFLLVIRAQKERKSSNSDFETSEREYMFSVDPRADMGKAKSSLEDGVLTLRAPKKEGASKVIVIK